MNPKTEVQHRALKLSKDLPPLTKNQLIWGQNLFDRWKYEWKYDYSCFECGHKFPKSKKDTCPKCKSKLQLYKERQRKNQDYWLMAVFTTIKEFQVLRYFRINKYMRVDNPAEYFFTEVYQHWISKEGKYVLISKLISPFSNWRFDPWSRYSELEIRGYPSQQHLMQDVPLYPKKRWLPEIWRNGFTGNYYKFHPAQLFTLILSSSIAETFFKAGNIEMLRTFSKNQKDFTRFWPSYKICLRHGYKIKDISDWLDHIKLLAFFKYDTRSPKYICSDTFYEDHQRLIRKKRIIDQIRDEEKRKLNKIKWEAEQKEKKIKEERAMKSKLKFKDLVFNENNIRIVVLSSAKEVKKEGDMLQHCVYESEYHKKPFSLLLSARKNGRRLETIEVDLRDIKITQIRGYENQPTKYHDDILKVMENNLYKIKELVA